MAYKRGNKKFYDGYRVKFGLNFNESYLLFQFLNFKPERNIVSINNQICQLLEKKVLYKCPQKFTHLLTKRKLLIGMKPTRPKPINTL